MMAAPRRLMFWKQMLLHCCPHDSTAGYGYAFYSDVTSEMYFEEEKNGAAPVSMLQWRQLPRIA